MQYTPLIPNDESASEIAVIFHLKGYNPEHSIERMIPDGYTSLVIELDGQKRFIYNNETLQPIQECSGSWLSGNYQNYLSFSSIKETALIGVRFKPGGLYFYTDMAMNKLKDVVVPGKQVYGCAIEELREELMLEKDSLTINRMVLEWLKDQKSKYNKVGNNKITEALHMILHGPNNKEISQLANQSGYSEKHFIHLFKKHVGFTPKVFQRIIKFGQILPKIQNNEKISWTQISHECGYYDQSHFIKDFKRYSGFNPTKFLNKDYDRDNFFPIENP